MRILDENGKEISNDDVDYNLGYLKEESILVAHHDAEPAKSAVKEVSHYETIKEYPETGGKDVKKIIDVPAQDATPAKDAWDEYETILRYHLYTKEELDERARSNAESELANSVIPVQQRLAINLLVKSNTISIDDNNAEQLSALLPQFDKNVAYKAGEIVKDQGKLYRAVQDVPAGTGYPDAQPTFWNRIGKPDADGVYSWIQPYGATDAYMKGDVVAHNDRRWTSDVDYNVWEPGVANWTEKTK